MNALELLLNSLGPELSGALYEMCETSEDPEYQKFADIHEVEHDTI